jgi:hypothetical protein
MSRFEAEIEAAAQWVVGQLPGLMGTGVPGPFDRAVRKANEARRSEMLSLFREKARAKAAATRKDDFEMTFVVILRSGIQADHVFHIGQGFARARNSLAGPWKPIYGTPPADPPA